MSEHTEKTLAQLQQCLLPGNSQDGIDLEIPSWLVRNAVTALAALETELEQWRAEAQDANDPKVRPMTTLEHALMDAQATIGQLEAKLSKMEEALLQTMAQNPECPLCRAGMEHSPSEPDWWKLNHRESCAWLEALAGDIDDG